jgi:hypothetical protein
MSAFNSTSLKPGGTLQERSAKIIEDMPKDTISRKDIIALQGRAPIGDKRKYWHKLDIGAKSHALAQLEWVDKGEATLM